MKHSVPSGRRPISYLVSTRMRPRRSASCWPNANSARAHLGRAVEVGRAEGAQLEDLRARHGLVVEALLGLRRRRQDRLGQALILLHAVGQVVAAERAAALRVVRPDRRRRDARQVRAHHELDRQRLAFARDGDGRIGHVDDVVRRDVGGRLEPERRHLVQHLALERNRAQHDVERADPVGRDQRPPSRRARSSRAPCPRTSRRARESSCCPASCPAARESRLRRSICS